MEQSTGTDAINTPAFFARLQRCDQEAVGILCYEYFGDLLNFLQKTKRRHGLAESEWRDAAQEVFVKFLTKPPELDPSRQIKPLLLTMVFNEARDLAKRGRRRAAREGTAQFERFRQAAGAETVGTRLIAAENKVLVEGKLAQLSPDDQQALAAYVRGGPSRHAANLAAEIGLKPGIAQMRYQRAKTRLKKRLEEQERKDAR